MKKITIQEYHDHLIAIRDYHMEYSFGINMANLDNLPYSEHAFPTISGKLIHSPIKDTKNISINIMAKRDSDALLNASDNPDNIKFLGVGYIEKRKTNI